MDIVLVGAGRLAIQLGSALQARGHRITAVFSRTMSSAVSLAQLLDADATDDVNRLPLQADAFILSVKDSALTNLIPSLSKGRQQQYFFHTAGSMPMSVFRNSVEHCGEQQCGIDHCILEHYGVIYPMQTFSKERKVDFSRVHIFIEGSDELALGRARAIATSVSNQVSELSSDKRRYLHLAAVFACNFSNHCYSLAATILEEQGLDFKSMLPLIAETAAKVETMHPLQAQTGPAIRFDKNVINAHLQLLDGHPRLQELYSLMTNSIHDNAPF